MKRELHTLYIKHDGQFKTLSKIALAQLILKIVYLKGNGISTRQIESELSTILSSAIANKDVEEAIRVLVRERKLNVKANKSYIHRDYQEQLTKEIEINKDLSTKVITKYFANAESKMGDIEDWFNDTVINFFEKYSFEWFQQIAYKGKNGSNSVPNIHQIIEHTLSVHTSLIHKDKEWLKKQFIKFVDSEDSDDNLLFWYYGISMFSSRLITARNYADGMTIRMFENSKFVLDTNILMILDLEEHELSNSLKALENILVQLNIEPVYLYTTRKEYLKAMDWRRTETIKIFENFTLSVLKSSDCPFIQTALRRGCNNGEDVKRMFESLMDMPNKFNRCLEIKSYDYDELNKAIEDGENNDQLKGEINETYKKRTGRDKRENPIIHDAALISGATYMRSHNEKCWIVTSDSTLKRYAIEHCVRDENEIAVGLDVIIGLMAVNSGGTSVDASNFAPLFKNLIKYSLVPESKAFEVKDLAFILRTNIKVNELSNERVIEVAKEVKRLRIIGEEEENVALYLRRVMEGDTVGMIKNVEEALTNESLAKAKREEAERERDAAYSSIKSKRQGELRDQYDKTLRWNRFYMFGIPIFVGLLVYSTLKYALDIENNVVQYSIGCSVELIFGLLPLIFVNRRIVRKHSEYVNQIDCVIDNEIFELKKKSN